MARNTLPSYLQSQHWERTGQIASMIGLINYIIYNHQDIPSTVKTELHSASSSLNAAYKLEARNNYFLNPSRKVRWK